MRSCSLWYNAVLSKLCPVAIVNFWLDGLLIKRYRRKIADNKKGACMTAKFGTAGQCDGARAAKIKSTLQFLDYLAQNDLHAFEYASGRGVNIGEKTALLLGERARELGISMSIHAPYYISLASLEEAKREKSIQYILDSAHAVQAMGGRRIVVHPGGLNKQSRQEALSIAQQTLKRAQQALDEQGLEEIILCPETMGKISQLGDLDEVIGLCEVDDRMIPCVDFGHMNARTLGSLRTRQDFAAILDKLCNALGQERIQQLHVHFSKIEYSAGGEKRHLTFEQNEGFGPAFEPLMEEFIDRALCPVVICESAGTQTKDARAMQDYYNSLLVHI